MENSEQTPPTFWSELARELRDAWRQAGDEWQKLRVSLRNGLRRARSAHIDYVVLNIGGTLPERTEPPRGFIERQLPLPAPDISLQVINARFRRIADADNVKGVVIILRGFNTGVASLQNLRRAIQRLQARGKEVVVFMPVLSQGSYFVATAADRIIATPGLFFEVMGLSTEAVFLKDALQQIGVSADVIQISPYKTAGNTLGESTITPEQREQLEWLLDDQYDVITAAMAAGRGLEQAAFQALIDQAPFPVQAALEAGLIDDIAYEDELVYLLATQAESEADKTAEIGAKEGKQGNGRPRASLVPYGEAHGLLLEKVRRRTAKAIGVISLEGTITMGSSQRPPIDLPIPLLGGATAGESTLRQQIRAVERRHDLAALILHVDSPGGSALASDLMGREIERLAQKMPVLAYMGNVAASGGYYVSAPTRHIMSQELTITGSIGVIMVRLATAGLLQKLSVNRVTLKRGQHADLYTDPAPLSPEERSLLWRTVLDSYQQFKQVVANGRSLPIEELDPICEGRVWTGRQARPLQLVDSHGDFVDAIRQAAEMGGLPTDDAHLIPVINLYPEDDDYRLPQPYEAADAVRRLLNGEWLRQMNGQLWLQMPFYLRFW